MNIIGPGLRFIALAVACASRAACAPRTATLACATPRENVIFSTKGLNDFRGNSPRVSVMVSSTDLSSSSSKIILEEAVLDKETCELLSEIGPDVEEVNQDPRLDSGVVLARLGLSDNKGLEVVDAFGGPSSKDTFGLIQDTENHKNKYLLIKDDSNGEKVTFALPDNLESTRMLVDKDGKLVFLSRSSGRLVLEKRDPSTLESLEPVKDLGECSYKTEINTVSDKVFLVKDKDGKQVSVVKLDGDQILIPLNGCKLGGLNVCLTEDCGTISMMLIPNLYTEDQLCKAQSELQRKICSGSGIFDLSNENVGVRGLKGFQIINK